MYTYSTVQCTVHTVLLKDCLILKQGSNNHRGADVAEFRRTVNSTVEHDCQDFELKRAFVEFSGAIPRSDSNSWTEDPQNSNRLLRTTEWRAL